MKETLRIFTFCIVMLAINSCKKEDGLKKILAKPTELQQKLINLGPWAIPVNDNTNTQIGYMVWEFSETNITRNGYDMNHRIDNSVYTELIRSYTISDSLITSEIHSVFTKPMRIVSVDSNQLDARFTNGYGWLFDAFRK